MDAIVADGLWLDTPRTMIGEFTGTPTLVPAE
jgi:hypothetical protein